MKNLFLSLTLAMFSVMAFGQNSSGGISTGAMIFNTGKRTNHGFLYNANIRTQFDELLGWQTEVGYGQYGDENEFVTLSTSVTAKLFDLHGLIGEMSVGPGVFKSTESDEMRGLAHSEFFLATKLTNKIVFGMPITYDYVFWDRSHFYSFGVSLRYHL